MTSARQQSGWDQLAARNDDDELRPRATTLKSRPSVAVQSAWPETQRSMSFGKAHGVPGSDALSRVLNLWCAKAGRVEQQKQESCFRSGAMHSARLVSGTHSSDGSHHGELSPSFEVRVSRWYHVATCVPSLVTLVLPLPRVAPGQFASFRARQAIAPDSQVQLALINSASPPRSTGPATPQSWANPLRLA